MVAYNTVQTVLTILHRKKRVTRRLVGKAFVYDAAVSQERTALGALREMIDKLFGGSATELVMALIGPGTLTPAERRRVRALIRKHKRS